LLCVVLLRSEEIRYNLTLDALRAKARASFVSAEDKSDRRISRTANISDRLCVTENFRMSASASALSSPAAGTHKGILNETKALMSESGEKGSVCVLCGYLLRLREAFN